KPGETQSFFEYQVIHGGFPTISDPPDLAFAAWCYRLGKEELAHELLEAIRAGKTERRLVPNQDGRKIEYALDDLRSKLRSDLTWISWAGMVRAFQTTKMNWHGAMANSCCSILRKDWLAIRKLKS